MNEMIIAELCLRTLGTNPKYIKRCSVGQGNYVYIVECGRIKYVIRCSEEKNAYDNTTYYLKQLLSLDVPVPKVIEKGVFSGYTYIILTYIEGKDIGLIYPQLSSNDKKNIAHEIVSIQNKLEMFKLNDINETWSWLDFVNDMMERARRRIVHNGYFDPERLERVWKQADKLKEYFDKIRPIAYLDDISSKNLIILNGHISGVIDIDWIGIGDKLTYVALTNMALLNMEYDTDYVEYIMDEMHLNLTERKAVLFYTLMYCVDFMGERGMQFMDKKIEVNKEIVDRLNTIYDKLWEEWSMIINQ